MNEAVLYTANDGVATITLNRPETRNALSDAILTGLMTALEQARDDATVRAVVLTGAGKGFCSGADLGMFGTTIIPDTMHEYLVTRYEPLMALMTGLPKPIVGAINGWAAGAGASLALACDLRLIADDGGMVQAFSNIGLIPDAGATWLLVRLVGYARAFELAAEGERVSAERCAELGLVNQVVPAATLLEAAQARAAKLATRPTLAVGLLKQALYYALQHDLSSAIINEADVQRQTIMSADHREGVRAFLEKRTPQFRGE